MKFIFSTISAICRLLELITKYSQTTKKEFGVWILIIFDALSNAEMAFCRKFKGNQAFFVVDK
jgi:hypothetical protein